MRPVWATGDPPHTNKQTSTPQHTQQSSKFSLVELGRAALGLRPSGCSVVMGFGGQYSVNQETPREKRQPLGLRLVSLQTLASSAGCLQHKLELSIFISPEALWLGRKPRKTHLSRRLGKALIKCHLVGLPACHCGCFVCIFVPAVFRMAHGRSCFGAQTREFFRAPGGFVPPTSSDLWISNSLPVTHICAQNQKSNTCL